MGILIQEVDVQAELEALRAIHNANRERPASAERFRWSYLDNPDGRATAWLAVDDRTGESAGFTAVFPRRVRLGESGRHVLAWNCGDFSITKRYRTMGVALKLRRAAKQRIDAGDLPFLYAHPNDGMVHVHQAAGHGRLGTMVRYVKVLRAPAGPEWARSLSAAVLRLYGTDWSVRLPRGVECEFGDTAAEEYTELFDRASTNGRTAIVRDARYLDWRFCRNPIEDAGLMAVRRSGALVGYVAFTVRGDYVAIKDWLADGDQARDWMFSCFITEMRRRRLQWISITVLEEHPDTSRLRRFGFVRKKGATAVVVYGSPEYRTSIETPAHWYMTAGDRDV